MAAISSNNFFGNLHNLGHAHGHYRFPTLEAFKTDLVAKAAATLSTALICVTNEVQTIERKYLDDLGFTSQRVSMSLIVHTIARDQLLKGE